MFFFYHMQILTDISLIPSQKFLPPISIGMLSSTPIGPLWIALSNLGIVALDWSMPQDEFTQQIHDRFNANVIYDNVLTADPLRQLSEYLSGKRREFDLVLHLTRMTEFQVKVLKLTLDIPYGQTATYKEIATGLGNPRSARAVGLMEAVNPIPLLIPCHRVIGSDGSLHGYGGPGGINLKAWLLQLEQRKD
jgi:methylated-DNA-[protein]-cysteine S-methyltransferase